MLRIAITALLLGALALVAGLALFFSPPVDSGRQVAPITWQPLKARVIQGFATIDDKEMQLELDSEGKGTVRLASQKFKATDYPFLHLALEESSENLHVVLAWISSDDPKQSQTHILESEPRRSLWLATAELKGWTGDINSVQLFFFGPAGELIGIRDFAVFPASPAHQLQAILSDLQGYESWNRAAMNTHSGVTPVSSFYPVPLAVALLSLSALAYGLLLLVFRNRLKFNLRVMALLFLACWISLDLVWQNQLLHQVADTYRTFVGRNTPQKHAVGPDAALYRFIAQVKPLMHPEDARVFVDSGDEYQGLRAAYYLYPFNVYWPEPGQKFPSRQQLRSGDYIVLIPPTTLQFIPLGRRLAFSPNNVVRVELILRDAMGTVVRMK